MKHLDLFSGIGGFSLAASWVWGDDHEIVAFVEIDPFCQKVLKKHWPDVPIIPDIRGVVTPEKYRPKIDLLTGGFPCQPYSVAGKQRGAKDDRALWPQMLRVIREVRPTWIIGENVAGIINMELDQVLSDLESAAYEVQPFLIPACGVDAPHRRDRVWIVAHNKEQVDRQGYEKSCKGQIQQSGIGNQSPDVSVTDASRIQQGRQNQRSERQRTWQGGESINVCDSERSGLSGNNRRRSRKEFKNGCEDVADNEIGGWSDSSTKKKRNSCQGIKKRQSQKSASDRRCSIGRRNGKYSRWLSEPGLGRVAHGISRWLAEPNIPRVATAVPDRVNKLKALGNAIVPQCVLPIVQAIKEIEKV